MDFFIGIDVGTSGTKSLLVDSEGKILAQATAIYPLLTPQPGWTEQDPEQWWRAAVQGVRTIVSEAGIPADAVRGIGLSGQMHGSVFLDKNNTVIRPAILWNDQRTAAECREIERRVGGRKKLLQWVANPALTGFTAPKILWLRNHEPENFARVHHILLPKDYVLLRLTGAFATEVSDASGTLLLNVTQRRWSKEMLTALEIREEWLPPVFESPEVTGHLTTDAAKQMGLPSGIPVVGGGGDQAAGAVGTGAVEPGILSVALGTSGVVFAPSRAPSLDAEGRLHTFCHAVPGAWHVMGVMLAAGGSFQWFRNALAKEEQLRARTENRDVYDILTEMAAGVPVGAENLFFLPYLSGERTPHADPNARGAFLGLSLRHRKEHLVRAVLEGITFGLRDSLEIIRALNIPIREIRVSGGGGKSPFWRQLLSDIFDEEIAVLNVEEGPAFGAALLAAVGTGAFESVEKACRVGVQVVDRVLPNTERAAEYEKRYRFFRTLYPALKDRFAELVRL